MHSLRFRSRPLLVTLMLLIRTVTAAKEVRADDIFGTWKLTKALDSADVSSMDDAQAAALVGKTLIVRRDAILFAGESCSAPELTWHREPAAQYVREGYHVRAGLFGLSKTVTVVDLRCTEALAKSKRKIVVFWNGYFYDAVKQ